jgi:diguanylate cyclase (GGDEF)-like protein
VIATFLVAFLLGRASTIAATRRLRTALREAAWRADHDPLTGLPNRTVALREIQAHLDSQAATGVALALVDLDDFKLVNDEHGHLAGDQVLATVAGRLAGFAQRCAAAAYRMAGDEFLLLLPLDERGRLVAPVGELLADLARPAAVTVEGTTVILAISASAGLTGPAEHAAGPQLLLHQADIALHHAKATGRPAVRYQPGMPMPAPVPPQRRRLRDHPRTAPPAGLLHGCGAADEQEGASDA